MNAFAQLVQALRRHPGCPGLHAELIAAHLEARPARDAAMAVHLLLGGTLPAGQRLAAQRIRRAVLEAARTPAWLLESCRDAVGSLSGTLARLLPSAVSPGDPDPGLWRTVHEEARGLRDARPETWANRLESAWQPLTVDARELWVQLMTGTFRSPATPATVAAAIAQVARCRSEAVAWLLSRAWTADAEGWTRLIQDAPGVAADRLPRRFTPRRDFHPAAEMSEPAAHWWVEGLDDGVTAQIVRIADAVHIWRADGGLLESQLPQLAGAAQRLPPGCVIEGRLLYGDESDKEGQPGPLFVASELLSDPGQEMAALSLEQRRQHLIRRVQQMTPEDPGAPRAAGVGNSPAQGELFAITVPQARPAIVVSQRLPAAGWDEVQAHYRESRRQGMRGLRLRPMGGDRGDEAWREWVAAPLECRGVLLSVELDPETRTPRPEGWGIGLRSGSGLVSAGRARLELGEPERTELEQQVGACLEGRFGPVRTVRPGIVLGLEFDAVRRSSRHRSGWVLQNPRIARWERSAALEQADDLPALLRRVAGGPVSGK